MKSVFLLFVCLGATVLSGQTVFTNPDSAFSYARRHSVAFGIGKQQRLLAKWTRVSAAANTVNFRNPVSFSATDNVLLPVNFIPGELFGAPPGTFREITLGQRYVSNFSFSPQVDIIHPYNLSLLKSASINEELTEANTLLAEQALMENLSAAWHNAAMFTEQESVAQRMLSVADSLVITVRNKAEAGIVRPQDLRIAEAGKVLAADRLSQLSAAKEQQLNMLRLLCDMPAGTAVSVGALPATISASGRSRSGALRERQLELQARLDESELKASRRAMLPVVSLVYFQNWQQFSNNGFFRSADPWIQSRYLGLRVTVPFPPEVGRLSQSYTNRVQHRISLFNAAHGKLQAEIDDRSLEVDQTRSLEAMSNAQRVLELKEEVFRATREQYEAGIIGTDHLLQAYNELLSARLQAVQTRASASFTSTKIIIKSRYQ